MVTNQFPPDVADGPTTSSCGHVNAQDRATSARPVAAKKKLWAFKSHYGPPKNKSTEKEDVLEEEKKEFDREKLPLVFVDLACCGPRPGHVVIHWPGQNQHHQSGRLAVKIVRSPPLRLLIISPELPRQPLK